MKGKTVVITGGTSGIGEIAAERLAQMGARIVLIARDKSRGEATLARLHERAPGLGRAVHYADLARIPEMKRVASEIAHKEPRIDVLINNAGAMFSSRRLRRPAIGEGVRSHESLWSLQALQYSFHALARCLQGTGVTANFLHPGFVATRFGD